MLISGGRVNMMLADVSDIPSSPVFGSITGWGTTPESTSGSIIGAIVVGGKTPAE